MVHALQEASRVLRPGGLLVDLRPISTGVQVQLQIAPGRWRAAGELDEKQFLADDAAADRAVAQAVNAGWLIPAGGRPFEFRWHFQTLDHMVEYLTEEWEDRVDDATLTRAAEQLAALPAPVDSPLCVRREMRFGVYRPAASG